MPGPAARPRTWAVGMLAVCLLASACSSDGPTTPVARSSSAPPVAIATPSPAAPPVPSVEASSAADPPFSATTAEDTSEPSGEPLTVVAARVGAQDGYDRVVLELAGGRGAPGWSVQYTDDPRQQGSGDPVKVKGAAVLAVIVRGVGYPFDTGVEEVSQDPALPPGAKAVTDVVLGSTFEGQYEAFIGTSGRLPFRVFRLSDPARVVIDVRHR